MTTIERVTLRTILTVALLVAACKHLPERCAFRDFEPSPYDHIIENIGHFRTPAFRGHISSKDILGPWPADLAQFEVHGENGFTAIVPVAEGGWFEHRLEPGEYCFKLSADGFRSMLGTVSISRGSRPEELSIPMIISE